MELPRSQKQGKIKSSPWRLCPLGKLMLKTSRTYPPSKKHSDGEVIIRRGIVLQSLGQIKKKLKLLSYVSSI